MWIVFSLLNAFFESLKDVQSKRKLVHVDEYVVGWAMNAFAGVLLFVVVVFNGIPVITQKFWIALAVRGIINFFTTVMYMRAIRETDLSLTVPLLTFTPALLLITSPIFVGEYPSFLGYVGVLLVVIGSYLLNIGEFREGWLAPFRALVRNRGSRIMVLIAVIWSISSNFDKIGLQGSSPLFWAASIHLFLGITLFPFMISRVRMQGLRARWRGLAIVGVVKALSAGFQMLAVSMTLVPYAISVKRMSAVMSVLWGHYHFKEKGMRARLLGTIIMVGGVILITLS